MSCNHLLAFLKICVYRDPRKHPFEDIKVMIQHRTKLFTSSLRTMPDDISSSPNWRTSMPRASLQAKSIPEFFRSAMLSGANMSSASLNSLHAYVKHLSTRASPCLPSVQWKSVKMGQDASLLGQDASLLSRSGRLCPSKSRIGQSLQHPQQ